MALHQAAWIGDVADLRRQVAKGKNVNERDALGYTALHSAAGSGHVEVLRVLVMELGADKEAKGPDGLRPIHGAALEGKVEAIKALVQMGVNKDAKDADGRTALHRAAANGHVEAITALVLLGADKEAKSDAGLTPLQHAALNRQLEAIKVLVQLGADKESKDPHGGTALHEAASMGRVEVIKVLVHLLSADRCTGCWRTDTTQGHHPPGSPSGGAAAEGAGTHRTRTEGGG
jgi:ankyrin repeat protein